MERKLDELLFALMQNMTIAVSGEKLARDLGVSHSTLVRSDRQASRREG
jgi:biotin operon repressor